MTLSATTGQVAQMLSAELVGRGDLVIDSVAGLEQAGASSLSFIRSGRYAAKWPSSRAAAALVTRGVSVPGHDPAARALLIVENADLAMLRLLEVVSQRAPMHRPREGVHPSAVIDPAARLGAGVRVGPGCVVGPGTEIGDGTTLMASVSLGAGVRVGPGCTLHPGVVVYDRCTLGARVILHAGTVIGADGFGYVPDPKTGALTKVPHVGTVELHDDVEIGANSCVDRGKFGATVIGAGTKIDNLCQIAHNCRIGRSAIICGMTGVAGGVTIGDGALVLGHAGIGDGISIGSGARIGAKSGVFENVPDGASWSGLPAAPHRQQMRSWAAVRRLPEVMRALKQSGSTTDAAGAPRRDLHL